MSKLEKLKERARSLEGKDPKGAIEAWLEVLKGQEQDGDPNPDLSVFNRIGDLYLKVKDPALAADYYDRAVDKYAELGFHNNAIAMCNKVLRNAPGRQTTYLKLAKLYASKGFMGEAKQNFAEYADRMHKAGKIQQAFAALKELADLSPEGAHLRETLEEHLRMYGAPERRSVAGAPAPAPSAKPPASGAPDLSKSGKRKTSSLVFLDVDSPPTVKDRPGVGTGRGAPVSKPVPPPPKAAPLPSPPPLEPAPISESLVEPVTAEPDTSLEIESTSLGEGLEPAGAAGMLEGFETTSAEFGDVRLAAGDVAPLQEEISPDEIPPPAEFEPTATEEAEPEPLLADDIEIEPPKAVAPSAGGRVAPVVPRRPGAAPPATPPKVVTPRAPTPAPRPPEPTKLKPVVPKRPGAAPSPPPAAEPPRRKTVVEVPPLELEPDFDTAEDEAPAPPAPPAAPAGHDIDDEPLALDDVAVSGPRSDFIQTEEDTSITTSGRRSAAIDLGLDGVVNQGDEAGSIVFDSMDVAPPKPAIEDLEARVADDPDDPESHQALGEALVESGDRERGVQELDLATAGFENRGNLAHACDLVDEILRLDPNSVRHRQKQVEFAFKLGDKAKLIDAYLELADTLLRSDLPDKARSVYQRVAEHDAGNTRAQAALAMLAPVVAPPPPAPAGRPKTKARDTEARTAPRDAKLKVRDDASDDGEFVDLSAMILSDDMPERDTRMKVADEEPTGDEEKDFQEMLARFKQGIDENIDEADFQSHYDLGVAFKEMGLLDEAIAELQKALRAPEGKLRSSEALGVCFIEKGAYVVAESILRRALELPASGDQERLGILYWLGRALEEQGKRVDARELYGRVFAVDIRFRDVGERTKALAKAK
ncbi:MAG TPA: tetratricopeptide repeat protein [Gemmatimonadales bacterium]|nr:tetratricopeptide repeat protein [Gemmatimonadales bacterium]